MMYPPLWLFLVVTALVNSTYHPQGRVSSTDSDNQLQFNNPNKLWLFPIPHGNPSAPATAVLATLETNLQLHLEPEPDIMTSPVPSILLSQYPSPRVAHPTSNQLESHSSPPNVEPPTPPTQPMLLQVETASMSASVTEPAAVYPSHDYSDWH